MANYSKISVPAEARVELTAGDWLRVAPEVKRRISAAVDSALTYVCIQVKAGSLEGFTMTDAVL